MSKSNSKEPALSAPAANTFENEVRYASAATIRRGIAAIEKHGAAVSRVIYRPDGSLEFIIGANDDEPSDFDRLEAAGLL